MVFLLLFTIMIKVSKDTLTFIDFCLYLENLTRIDFRIGYLENLQNASLVFFILIMLRSFSNIEFTSIGSIGNH